MIPYYVDERKYLLRTKDPLTKLKDDKQAGQPIYVSGSIFGATIRPGIRWTPLCEKLFHETGANGIRLEEITSAPGGNLGFVNNLPKCTRLMIEGEGKVDLSPLAGNSHLEDLQLSPSIRISNFDFATLPNLRRCQIPVRSELMSILNCNQIISLWLNGGSYKDSLRLDTLPCMEELICSGVSKLKSIILHPKVRVRSLELSNLKDFESIEPQKAITEELRVVQLNRVPRMKIEWLQQARKADCIALRLGEIPSINFLRGLKHLQVLDLFGSKVKDGDLSFRDSLKGKLDSELWSSKR